MTFEKLQQLAAAHEAYVIGDKDGTFAIQSRFYDEPGIQQVLYRPDPCFFISLPDWQRIIDDGNEIANYIA